MAAGRFRAGDAALVAHHMWIALHGMATLELGGYLVDPYNADVVLHQQLLLLMSAVGDALETAERSVADAKQRHSARQLAAAAQG